MAGIAEHVLLGFDKGSEDGDRSALAIRLTREQHAALMRADVPPGDPEGMKLKQEIADIRTKALAEDPLTGVHVFFEEVKERSGGDIVLSTVRPATPEEIEDARRLHMQGECPHNIVHDEKGWMYDYRSCVTCGKGLGAI